MKLIIALLCLVSCHAVANNSLVLTLGYDFGGDELVNTRDDDASDLKAGDGLWVTAAYEFYVSDRFYLKPELGFKYQGIDADDAEADFSRLPLSLSVNYDITPFMNIGVGIVAELGPELNIDDDRGNLEREDIDFDNAVGGFVRIGFIPVETLEIGLRATSIEYDPDNGFGDIDGDSIGLYVSGRLYQ